MNILPISSINLNQNVVDRNNMFGVRCSNFGLKMANPIGCDTILFKGSNPIESRAGAMSRKVVKDIHDIAQDRHSLATDLIHKIFGYRCCTEANPDNIITMIQDRVKSVDSIIEKALANNWTKKSEILLECTDLNGLKIVMRDGSRGMVKALLSDLEKAVKAREVIVVEIENKRAVVNEAKYDYAVPKWLEHLKSVNDSMYPSESTHLVLNPEKPSYPALHFLLKIPGQDWVFELQLTGYDVALYKDLDDIIYKILDNKEVDDKYKPLVDIIKPLNEPGNKADRDGFNRYRCRTFESQRSKSPFVRQQDHREHLLPLTDEIKSSKFIAELDMNNLYKIYLECNRPKADTTGQKGAKARKNKQ